MFNFEQCRPLTHFRYLARGSTDGRDTLAITNADKAAEYMRYAEHCVKTARILRGQEDRNLHREMAGEWMQLAQRLVEDAALSARLIPKRRKTRQR